VASNAPKIQRNSIPFSQPNGSPLNANLGFVAHSVIIDNRTSSYLYIPPANRWVDPGLGAAFAFPGVAGGLLIDWTAPPGKTQIAAIPTEQAQVTYFSDPVPPGFGITSTQPVAGGVTGIQQVDRQVLTSNTATITIPTSGSLSNLGSFNSIEIRVLARADAGGVTNTLYGNINNDSTNNNYFGTMIKGLGGGVSDVIAPVNTNAVLGDFWPANTALAGCWGCMILNIFEISTAIFHVIQWWGGAPNTNNSNNIEVAEGMTSYVVASTVASFTLSWAAAANFLAGSTFTTYGLP
jgi:hypothetical protein